MTDTTKQIEQAAEETLAVFKDSCNHTHQAIDYMKVVLLAARATPVSPAQTSKKLTDDAEALVSIAGHLREVKHWAAQASVRELAEMAQRFLAAAKAAPAKPQSDLSKQLREYAGNSGYSHGDYADTMRQAADELDRLSASVGAQVAGEPVAWIAYYDGQKSQNVARTREEKAEIERMADIMKVRDTLTWEALGPYTAPVPTPATVDRDAVLAELRGQVKDMQEAAYTYGDHSKEAVRVALDGVLDAIDELKGKAAPAAQAAVPGGWKPDLNHMGNLAKHLRDADAMESSGYWAFGHDAADYLDRLAAFLATPAAVPQGVEAQAERPVVAGEGLTEGQRPDLIERLSYHAHERDDMTIDEIVQTLSRDGYKRVRQRTHRQLEMQLLALLAERQPQPAGEVVKALQTLVDLYIANKDTDSEFICCITPPPARSMTAEQRSANKTWAAFDRARAALAAIQQDQQAGKEGA